MLLLLALIGCQGSAPTTATDTAAAGQTVYAGLPLPADLARQTSTTELVRAGWQFEFKAGKAWRLGDGLNMAGGAELPWAVYALSGLSEQNELTKVILQSAWPTGSTPTSMQLFIGKANFHRNFWDWVQVTAEQHTIAYDYPEHYRNEDGTAYLVIVYSGATEALIEQLKFTVSGTVVAAPDNLAATVPDVGRVDLSWDAVDLATGYNVYRMRSSATANPTLLNASPLTDTDYADHGVGTGYTYYYNVTAVASTESGPSNLASIWAHEVELPAPANAHVAAQGESSFDIGWEWSQTNPQNFYIYLSDLADFPLLSDTEREFVTGFARQKTVGEREPGVLYYWKMCAVNSAGRRGRMTEEQTAMTRDCWTWTDSETIGEGIPPIRIIPVEDQLAVAYVRDNEVQVAVGMINEYWEHDTALRQEVIPDGMTAFANAVDIAYDSGTYLVAADDAFCGDAWASFGTLYDWTQERVHGDGSGALMHPVSGLHIEAAINYREMAVLHLYLTGSHEPPTCSEVLLHLSPLGGHEWNQVKIREVDFQTILSQDICYHHDNLYLLTADIFVAEFYVCDKDGNWHMENVLPEGIDHVSKHIDLAWFDDKWNSTAFHYADQQLFLLSGIEAPWDVDPITELEIDMGHEARLATDGELSVMIFFGMVQGLPTYQFATSLDDWDYMPIRVPGVEPGDYNDGADIAVIDGAPYIVFWDQEDRLIKIAKGTPPAT
ncbi:hypothetical protein JW859_10785 [bacterium]|nr:hypothetical protein [bacterium]